MKEKNMARACVRDARISRKHALEIANFIRGKNVQKAKSMLELVLKKKIAVPFKSFNRDVGHKANISAGRYPENASSAFISLLNSVESNAQDNNMSPSDLFIYELRVNKGSTQWRHGRQKRRQQKRTHIDIVVKEQITEKALKEGKKETPQEKPKIETAKKEVKPEVKEMKKETPKVEEKKEAPKKENKKKEPKEEKKE